MRIRTFHALRPVPEQAHQIASLPYDVVSTEEARSLAAGKPNSLLHIIRAEIGFEAGMDPHSDEVYAMAVERFHQLKESGFLTREKEPSLYIYQQQMGSHVQQGVVALCHVEDYLKDRIRKHEKTRPDKEDDRTRLTSDLSANAEPVFLTFRDQSEIGKYMQQDLEADPLYDFVAEDGIRHTVWKSQHPEALVQAFREVDYFYVADGHHRSASAARVGKQRQLANPSHTGEEDYNWFLCVLFPASSLQILPYNRVVHHLNGRSKTEFQEAVGKVCQVRPVDFDAPDAAGKVCMYLDGQWYELTFANAEKQNPADQLDVSLLQHHILNPLLGVKDPRTAAHIEFVGGIRGASALVKAVDAGEAAVAFSMYPVHIDSLFAISDAGEIMPPKSTWFEPKLRSGLFMHTF